MYMEAEHMKGSRAGNMLWIRGVWSTVGALTVALQPSFLFSKLHLQTAQINVHQLVSSFKTYQRPNQRIGPASEVS